MQFIFSFKWIFLIIDNGKRLKRENCDLNVENNDKHSMLHCMWENGFIEIVIWLSLFSNTFGK